MEALSQLRCIDGLSAAPVLHLATSRARSMEEAGQLDIAALNQLTRLARAVAVVAGTWPPLVCLWKWRRREVRCPPPLHLSACIFHPPGAPSSPAAATSTVHSSLLVGASAMWHLLTLRSEALTQQVVSEAASGGSDGSQLAPTLASMWATSHLLMACARMESNTFQLPAHLK